MQARVSWTAPGGALGRLVENARGRALALGSEQAWAARARASTPAPLFGRVLDSDRVSVIAELKRRSPSAGILTDMMDAAWRARQYQEGGAAALSVLTEPTEFGGSLHDLEDVRAAVRLPLLRKDFLVRPVQLFEARAAGASAVLLIVRALGPHDTPIMAAAAAEAGVEVLFEVRNEQELGWALDARARIVGVNRRNLETLEMESAVLESVLPQVPPFLFAIAESGIATRRDVEQVAELGADGVLVGSSLSTAPDAAGAVAELASVTRRIGARA